MFVFRLRGTRLAYILQLSLNALQGLGLKWSHRAHAFAPERARAYYAGLETGVDSHRVAGGSWLLVADC